MDIESNVFDIFDSAENLFEGTITAMGYIALYLILAPAFME